MKQAEIDFHVQTIGLNIHAIGAGLSFDKVEVFQPTLAPMICATSFVAMSLGMRLKQPPDSVVGAIHGVSMRLCELAVAISDDAPTREALIAGPWSMVCSAHNQFLREMAALASPEVLGDLWPALSEVRAAAAAATKEN
jgi:hypothetical protein